MIWPAIFLLCLGLTAFDYVTTRMRLRRRFRVRMTVAEQRLYWEGDELIACDPTGASFEPKACRIISFGVNDQTALLEVME